MKLVKSLLLSSAAGITAVASAQAADLPFRKAAPVEYVRVCDYTGAGYFYLPGTDTCLKFEGYAQGNAAYVNTGRFYAPSVRTTFAAGVNPFVGQRAAIDNTGVIVNDRNRDQSGLKTEGRLAVDARTQTAYGTLRTYVRFQADAAGGIYTGNPAGAAISNPVGTPGGIQNTAYIDKAFVQFAGFTAGRVQSAFDFYADNYNYEGIANSDVSTEVFQYTATFGGGFSATISIEDPTARRNGVRNTIDPTSGVLNAAGTFTSFNTTNVNFGGEQIPEIVGVIRLDQAWGAAQLSGAYHQVNLVQTNSVATAAGGALIGVPTTSVGRDGFAVQAGVQIKLPMLAAGDQLWLEGAYTNGAYRYIDSSSNLNSGVNSGLLGGFVHQDADAIAFRNANGSYSVSLVEGYSVMGAFQHYFTPNFYDVVFGSYIDVSYGNRARNTDWTAGGLGNGSEYRIGNQFIWTPVNNLIAGIEVLYAHLDQTLAHNPGAPATALPANVRKDPSAFEARVRLERDF